MLLRVEAGLVEGELIHHAQGIVEERSVVLSIQHG